MLSDLNALTFDQSLISGLSIMSSFSHENVHLKRASDVEYTAIAAHEKTVYFTVHLHSLKLCQCNNSRCPNLHSKALVFILFALLEMKLLLYTSYLNKLNYMPILEAE